MISTNEAAAILGVHPSRVRQFAQEGRLTAKRIANVWLFEEADVAAFAKEPRKHGRKPGFSYSASVIAKLKAEEGAYDS